MSESCHTGRDENKWFLLVNRLVRWGIGLSLIWFGGGLKGELPALIVGSIFFISGFFRPRGCIDGSCNNKQ